MTTLLAFSLQAAAVVIAVDVALRLLPVARPAMRLRLWQAALGVCVVLPLLPTPPSAAFAVDVSVLASAPAGQPVAGAGAPASVSVLFALIAAGVVLRMVWVAFGLWRLRTLRGSSTAATLGEALDAMRWQLAPRADVREHPDVRVPVTFGWRHPIVLVPLDFSALPAAGQHAVLWHELTHIARRDWLWLMAEETILCVLWFHPAVWWAVLRLRLAREEVIDGIVVTRTGERAAYMSTLLALAEQPVLLVPALPSIRGRELVERFARLTAAIPSRRVDAVRAAGVAAAIAASTVAAACVIPLRGGAPVRVVDGMPAIHLVRQIKPEYTPEAMIAGLQGRVELDLTIARDGSVKTVQVLKSLPGLDEQAIAAARQWRFSPPRLNGQPVEAIVTVLHTFTLR